MFYSFSHLKVSCSSTDLKNLLPSCRNGYTFVVCGLSIGVSIGQYLVGNDSDALLMK